MKNKDLYEYLLFVGTLLLFIDVTQPLSNGKKYPAYSLQNMPKTDFSCRDKILGGYYADADTQCQMFHICVKVAGVGVQDFRFLCPNGTAFDQEAQTCADFGDVDCEQATLYYGSDNFDLYRIGSGFETKRIPLAAEEESTFHLQRAESNDLRRSKGPNGLQNKQQYNYGQQLNGQQAQFDIASVRPAKQYQPQKVTTTTTTTTTSTTTPRYNVIDRNPSSTAQPYIANKPAPLVSAQHKQYANSNNNDEIFKGSHSSNFYSGRNQNDDDDDYKHRNVQTSTKSRQKHRGRAHYRGTPATTSTTTFRPIVQNYTTPQAFTTTISPSANAQYRFILSSTIRSTATSANAANQISTSTPLGPLQQQYQQPIYNNNNFANFRTYATSTSPAPFTSTQSQLKNFPTNNFNPIYSTPSSFNVPQRPSGSVPTPFNSLSNVNNNNNQFNYNNNQKNLFNSNTTSSSPSSSSSSAKQQSGKSFDNHNPINNYQTTSPFANHQPIYNQKQPFLTNYTNSASTRLAPSAQNQATVRQQSVQSTRNQRTNNNNERVPTTAPPIKITTQNNAARTTQKPNFSQQDYINQFNFEQQRLSQQRQQAQSQPQQLRLQPQPQSQPQSQSQTHTQEQSRPQISLEQKRLQLHYDINDYLSTDKSTPLSQYSPTSEQYRSVQTYSHPNADYPSSKQNKKIVEAYTQKYNAPKQTSQTQKHLPNFAFTTTTVSNRNAAPNAYDQYKQFQTQQDRPAPIAPQASFNSPINVPGSYASKPTQNPIAPPESTNQNSIPSTVKKFSTLVPKENYAPTTFKPAFYFNVAKQINDHLSTPSKQQNANSFISSQPTTSTTSTVRSTSINYSQQQSYNQQLNYKQPQIHSPSQLQSQLQPISKPQQSNQSAAKTTNANGNGNGNAGGIDEHDGQYHPELYEKDFARYKIKNRKKQQQQKFQSFNSQNFNNAKSYVPNVQSEKQKSFISSVEEEILNTAHSQNIAATGNELWAANSKAANANAKQSNAISSKIPSTTAKGTTIKSTTNKQPQTINKKTSSEKRDEDVSYDYAYYDSGNDAPHEYSDLEIIDFGKTKN